MSTPRNRFPTKTQPISPGDSSKIILADINLTKKKYTKYATYFLCEFAFGIALYAPNIQQFLKSLHHNQNWRLFITLMTSNFDLKKIVNANIEQPENDTIQNLSKLQYFCLIFGIIISLHALINLLILIWQFNFAKNLSGGFGQKLNKIQQNLLGLVKENSFVKKPVDKRVNKHVKLVDESVLIEDTLPEINQPLLDSTLRSPVAKEKSHSSPVKNGLLLPETTALLSSPAFKNNFGQYNPDDTDIDSLFVSKNNSLSLLKNINLSMEEDSFKRNDDSFNNSRKTAYNTSSFIKNKSTSFVNSFNDTTRVSTNYGNVSSLNDSFKCENKFNNAWNNSNWNNDWKDDSMQLDQSLLKKQMADQVYRLSTPPNSPNKNFDENLNKDCSILKDKKPPTSDKNENDIQIKNSFNFKLSDKHDKIDALKGWLNGSIFVPLAKELNDVDNVFKSKGMRSLGSLSFARLLYILSDTPEITLLEKEDKNFQMELPNFKKNLEPFKAKLLRLLPYLRITTNGNSTYKLNQPLESIINRVKILAKFGYLSCYKESTDGPIINNCIIQYMNSQLLKTNANRYSPLLKSKNWFSSKYITGDIISDKNIWIENFKNFDNVVIRQLLMEIATQQGKSPDEKDKLVNKISPFLIKVSNEGVLNQNSQTNGTTGLLLVENSKNIYDLTGYNAIFETWLAFFELLKTDNDQSIVNLLPI